MNRFIVTIIALVALLSGLSGIAGAEVVKGKVKAIAGESRLFTFAIDQGEVLFIAWDSKTAWQGIGSAANLKPGEALTVDFRQSGEVAVAGSVSRIKTPVPAGMKEITLELLLENLTGPDSSRPTFLLDTRPTELYDAGHIPGAINVPLARLQKKAYSLLPENKGAKIIFHDQGQGGASAGKSAEIAAKIGYTDIAVFTDGTAGWLDSGRVLAASTAFIRKSKPVVIDIRSEEQVAQGHIEGAVNYPASRLKDYYGYFPLERLAPIVVYGASDKEAVAGAGIIKAWGYKNVTIYPGGAVAWVKKSEVLESGPAGVQIFFSAARHGGKLKPEDFELALASTVMVEIVDVRTAAEQKKGGFPRARSIPLAELAKRHGELDREKIQVVFAADTDRAEMAYDFLKSKKYRVNYLNGFVEFGKDGRYTLK